MIIVNHAVGCQTLQAVSQLSASDSWERLQLPNDPELDYQKKVDVWMDGNCDKCLYVHLFLCGYTHNLCQQMCTVFKRLYRCIVVAFPHWSVPFAFVTPCMNYHYHSY